MARPQQLGEMESVRWISRATSCPNITFELKLQDRWLDIEVSIIDIWKTCCVQDFNIIQ